MITKETFKVTPRKIVLEPDFEGGEFKGVRVSMTAEAVVPGIGKQDIGMVSFEVPASEMGSMELATYALFVERFEGLAKEQLGCQ